jgi:hypothetical protein
VDKGNCLSIWIPDGAIMTSRKELETAIYTIGCGFWAAWIYAWVRFVKNKFR